MVVTLWRSVTFIQVIAFDVDEVKREVVLYWDREVASSAVKNCWLRHNVNELKVIDIQFLSKFNHFLFITPLGSWVRAPFHNEFYMYSTFPFNKLLHISFRMQCALNRCLDICCTLQVSFIRVNELKFLITWPRGMKCEHRFPSAANLNTFINRVLGTLITLFVKLFLKPIRRNCEHFMLKDIFPSNGDSTCHSSCEKPKWFGGTFPVTNAKPCCRHHRF